MARGGFRPGGGRPPGIVETRPRRRKKPSGDSDQAKIRQMLSMGIRAKARMYKELLRRIGENENLTIGEKKLLLSLGEELAAEVGEKPPDIAADAAAENQTPLDYMLKIMRDPNESTDLRCRMAVSAAPYTHPRRGEAAAGKKDERADRAKSAGKGKFRASAPPNVKLVK